MTTIIPGTINGVEQTSTFLSRLSESAVIINTTSSYITFPIFIKAICTAPIVKKVPVQFFAITTNSGVTTTTNIGSATFEESQAILAATNIPAGTSTIRAVWPGEGRWKGFNKLTTSTLQLLPGIPYPGVVSVTRTSGNLYPTTATFTVSSTAATTSSGLVRLIRDDIQSGLLTFSTATWNPATNQATLTISPEQITPNLVNEAYQLRAFWDGGEINGVYNLSTSSPAFTYYSAVRPDVILSTSQPYSINTLTLTLSATLQYPSGNFTDTGVTVSFFDGGTLLGTSTTTNNLATLNVTNLTTGTHQLTATYNGSVGTTGFLFTTSNVVNQTIISNTPGIFYVPSTPFETIYKNVTSDVTVLFVTNNYSLTSRPTLRYWAATNPLSANFNPDPQFPPSNLAMSTLTNGVSYYTTPIGYYPHQIIYNRITNTGSNSVVRPMDIGIVLQTDSNGECTINNYHTYFNGLTNKFQIQLTYRTDVLTNPNDPLVQPAVSFRYRGSLATRGNNGVYTDTAPPPVFESPADGLPIVVQFQLASVTSTPQPLIFRSTPNTKFRFSRMVPYVNT